MLNHCYIYRCAAKTDMYLYLAKENDFEAIDEDLLKKLGDLTFAMTLKLDKDTKLAKEDPQKVKENLATQGFHLQLPPATSIEELMEKIAKKTL